VPIAVAVGLGVGEVVGGIAESRFAYSIGAKWASSPALEFAGSVGYGLLAPPGAPNLPSPGYDAGRAAWGLLSRAQRDFGGGNDNPRNVVRIMMDVVLRVRPDGKTARLFAKLKGYIDIQKGYGKYGWSPWDQIQSSVLEEVGNILLLREGGPGVTEELRGLQQMLREVEARLRSD
jgi:hypothetical protein